MTTMLEKKPARTLYALLVLAILLIISPALTLGSEIGVQDTSNNTQQPAAAAGKDAHMLSGSPNQNFGVDTEMDINPGNRNLLIQFDLSSIPSNAKITSATLRLYVTASGLPPNPVVNVHRVTQAWTEGTGNGAVTNDGATWNKYDGVNNWASGGGDYDSTVWNSTTVTAINAWYSWNLTAIVQNWVNGTYTNNGMLLRTTTSSSGTTSFVTSDNSNASLRPILEVIYATPPRWSSQAQNSSAPPQGSAVKLSAFWDDNSTLSHAWLSTNESGSWNNYSLTALSGSSSWSNFTWNNASVSVGTVVGWKIYANNTNSQSNVTSTMAFTIASNDTNAPSIAIIRPQNTTYTSQSNLQLNYTATDASGISQCWYSLDGAANVTLASCANSTFSVASDGLHNVRVHSNDTLGNAGSAIVYFTVDTTPPASVTGLGETSTGQEWINWAWTNPSNSDFSQAIIYIDGTNVANSSSASYNATGLTCGTSYTINIHTKDTTGNVNNTNVTDSASTAACSDLQAPQYSNLEEPSDPATYSSSASYQFNSTWTDNVAISTVILEFDGTNYTASNSGSIYYKSFGALAAGTYNYRWYSNDTGGNWNATSQQTYTISKAATTLTLTASPSWGETYGTETTVECTADNAEVAEQLYRNGTLVSNPDVQTLAASSYFYNCTAAETENYTSDEETNTLVVGKAATTTELYLDSVQANRTVLQGAETNATAVTSAGTVSLYRDGSAVSNPEIATLALGTYNYTAANAGNENYTGSSKTWFLFVNSVPDVTPPGSVTNLGEYSTATTWIAWNWTNPADSDFTQAIVYVDGINVVNTSSSSYNATGFTCETSHNITVHTKDSSGNVNNTDVSDSATTSACSDVTAPIITSISAGSIATDSAKINWITDEAANSTVNYGATDALGSIKENSTLATSHNITLSSLSSATTYFYNITSCDASGNCNTTGARNFTTSAPQNQGGGGGGGGSGGSGGGNSNNNNRPAATVNTTINTANTTQAKKITTAGHLFDILLELKNAELTRDGALIFFVELFDVGEKNATEKIDVTISYVISDVNGTNVYQETETRAVFGHLEYKEILAETNLEPGSYTLKVTAIYGENQVASAAKNFLITKEGELLVPFSGAATASGFNSGLTYNGLLLVAALAVALALIVALMRMQQPKHRIERLIKR